uniref:DUF1838 domain-containing protein n=1 Tax=Haliea sp. ETY-M TaxID=1055105 RepID=A0A455R1Q6_9GAMM|nr:hypothetical protein [Haliea sp. ETY-M]
MLAGGGFLALASAAPNIAGAAHWDGEWLPGSDDDVWRHTVRMQGSTKPEDVVWWYTGRIYAQVGESEPRHLFNLEGTEIYYYEAHPDGGFVVSSRTLTFFRDAESGAMIRRFDNPYTGKVNEVGANRLGGRHNARYDASGWRFVSPELGMGERSQPWTFEWQRAEDLAWFTSSRYLREMPQPWLECMTVFCPADALLDASRHNLPAHFSSTYLAPFPRWMEMGEHPGHVMWHSSGNKLSTAEAIPEEYRRRVAAEYGGVLTAHPDSFD